jgi:2-succinyl-5-enolpyruvyl-6-hydroxy-3-cyclohexene-1-carboxylate synthase
MGTPSPGPVHLNCPFREPLAPVAVPPETVEAVGRWVRQAREMPGRFTACGALEQMQPDGGDSASLRAISAAAAKEERVCVVAGALRNDEERHAVLALAKTLQCPLLPDITSGLRMVGEPNIIHHYDLALGSEAFRSLLRPTVVIHVGGAVVSKRLARCWTEHPPAVYAYIGGHSFRHDPEYAVTHAAGGSILLACRAITEAAGAGKANHRVEWARRLSRASAFIEAFLDGDGELTRQLTEPSVARMLTRMMESGDILFTGNSMPVRDLDMYAACGCGMTQVHANRGASGIDGCIATAAGVARGSGKPVMALIGDLSVLHDLNSLALLRQLPSPVILVVPNNDGGGIFHFLPIAGFPDVFEPYFATPHGLRFRQAAGMFGIPYTAPDSLVTLEESVRNARWSGRSAVIEFTSQRESNITLHRRLEQGCRAAVDEALR